MPRKAGPERAHFGGEDGMITETVGGHIKHFWRCNYCDFKIGGRVFANAKARIHLSGDVTLKNGMVGRVCEKAPEEVQKQFALLERSKRADARNKALTRKRGNEMLAASPSPEQKQKRSRQTQLPFIHTTLPDTDVDDAWGLACFGLDIAAHKINDELFRDAVRATQRSSNRLLCFVTI